MKRRVRIHKKQLGGVQAIQEQQQEQQQSQQQDQMIQASILGMLEEGALPEEVLDSLMKAGIDQEKATYLLNGAIEYRNDQARLREAEYTNDTEAYEDLMAEQQTLMDQSEEDRQDAILAQMYESDPYDEGYDEEDQFIQDYIMDSPQEEEIQKTGGVPNKRTFVRRASKAIKAQMGQEMAPPAKADSTDTGARQMMMASFLKSVQDTGNNALIKQDAEQAYNMTTQYPYSEGNMPEAQLGLNMRPGQQRRFNRRLNRAIGNIPISMQGMMPAGFITYPMLQGLQQYMPAQGSYYGGPQLANIDVRKTGLFGRPKEYTITFAQQALYDPTLRRDVIKQEARNQGVLTEDEVDELIKREEAIAGKKSETPKAEEKREASGKKDISSSSVSSASNSSSNRVNSTPAAETIVNEVVEPVASSFDSAKILAENAAKSAFLGNYRDIGQNYFGEKELPVKGNDVKSAYSNKATPTDMFYYNPDKPGYTYVYQNGKLYYDDATDKAQKFIEVKDAERIAQLNQKLKGADIYTLPSKKGFYYRQRPDGSYAKFEGDPAKHSISTKQVAIIKPGDKNYDYLDKNKQYTYSFSGVKKQFGGFTDQESGLTKFVYGGNDDIPALPPVGGKLTDSPYFEYGGSFDNGGQSDTTLVDILDDNGKVIGVTTLAVAEKKGLNHRVRTQKLEDSYDDYDYDGYNSYSPFVYPDETRFKQKGLPYFTGTGDVYKGYITPWTDLKSIDVKKRLLGPTKMTYNFGNYDPTKPLIGPNQSYSNSNVLTDQETPLRSSGNSLIENMVMSRVRPISLLGAKLLPNYTGYTGYEDVSQKSTDQQIYNDAASPAAGRRTIKNILTSGQTGNYSDLPSQEATAPGINPYIPFTSPPTLPPYAYGGDMDYAQTGENYPYLRDPRFAPVYTDNPDFVGMSDLDLIATDTTGMIGAPAGLGDQSVFAGYDPSVGAPDITQTTAYQQAQLDPTMNIQIDPNQPNRATQKRNLEGDFSIKGNVKKTNEQMRRGLDLFNVGAYGITGMLGERGQRDRTRQMYDRLKSDALYGSTGLYDRGTYEANSGLFRPDQMGFTGVVKKGGSVYKEGGTHYMSPAQVKKFLEEGGELEFV